MNARPSGRLLMSDRYFITTGPIITEWTFDEIDALTFADRLVLRQIVWTPTGLHFYYWRKVVK